MSRPAPAVLLAAWLAAAATADDLADLPAPLAAAEAGQVARYRLLSDPPPFDGTATFRVTAVEGDRVEIATSTEQVDEVEVYDRTATWADVFHFLGPDRPAAGTGSLLARARLVSSEVEPVERAVGGRTVGARRVELVYEAVRGQVTARVTDRIVWSPEVAALGIVERRLTIDIESGGLVQHRWVEWRLLEEDR